MKQLEKTDLLICDEWGYVPFEKEGSQLLFQVISECYEKRSVIITTNLEFSKWNGIFYDEKLTSAIIDRLVHHSHLLVFQGQSYRLTHSTMKSEYSGVLCATCPVSGGHPSGLTGTSIPV